ncbi:MAG: alpha-E domain-containing protein [Cyclobacteriaceae bacterium]|nr:alpha-E domain-containing protein [Cyclobacteriaceae bacterium]
MLSRVADAVFWMARYMERTDNVLRVLRTSYIASQDEIQDFNWQLWVDGLGAFSSNPNVKVSNYQEALNHMILSRENDTSVLTNIARARENARSVQDYITKEVWQVINEYYHLVRDPKTENLLLKNDPVTAFDNLLRESVLFHGTVDITMNRGEGYIFLSIGKYIERILRSLDILELKIREIENGGNEAMQWKYLLYALSGYEFHSKNYKNALQLEAVTHQIFLDVQFPHSVLYSLLQVERYFKRLEDISLPEHFKELEFLVGRATSNLRYTSKHNSGMEEVKSWIVETRLEVKGVSQKLANLYFGYS